MNFIKFVINEMKDFGPLQWAMVGVALLWYMMPSILALVKENPRKYKIMLANIFFGWSGLGWLFLMFWAAFGDRLFETSIKNSKKTSKK